MLKPENIIRHYGEEEFEEIFKKIILQKLSYYSFQSGHEEDECYNKDTHITAIRQNSER